MSTRHLELHNWRYSSRYRVAVASVGGLLVGLAFSGGASPILGLLWGWDMAAAVYTVWLLFTVFRLSSQQTARLASAEDPGRITLDVLMVLAGVASLVAVGIALFQSASVLSGAKTLLMSTCVASVVLSWLLVHMTFTLHYARSYYAAPKGGIDFNCDDDPSYLDFAYLSFTVGMTFQVSDTNITKTKIRHSILRHALLSYLFGTVILATTINLIAGLGK
jgi:uncharacterized membrane protein